MATGHKPEALWPKGLIRERAPQKKTYAGTQLGTSYTFKYPTGWRVSEEKKFPYMAELAIYDDKGAEMAGLSVLTSWDANGAAAQMRKVKSSDTPSVGSMSAAGTRLGDKPGASKFLVRTATMDLSPYPGEASGLGWDKPVAVAVSAGVWQVTATELAPFLLTGAGGIDATDTANGQPYASVVFATQRYFDTVPQAEGLRPEAPLSQYCSQRLVHGGDVQESRVKRLVGAGHVGHPACLFGVVRIVRVGQGVHDLLVPGNPS